MHKCKNLQLPPFEKHSRATTNIAHQISAGAIEDIFWRGATGSGGSGQFVLEASLFASCLVFACFCIFALLGGGGDDARKAINACALLCVCVCMRNRRTQRRKVEKHNHDQRKGLRCIELCIKGLRCLELCIINEKSKNIQMHPTLTTLSSATKCTTPSKYCKYC